MLGKYLHCLGFQVLGIMQLLPFMLCPYLCNTVFAGLNKNCAIFRYRLSVPLRCQFPFINSKASPSNYMYSSELKPGENEPFHYKKALTDASNKYTYDSVVLLKINSSRFLSAAYFPSFKRGRSLYFT